jgi:lipoprotein-anchoring transpeptidase ErfK/SrfK
MKNEIKSHKKQIVLGIGLFVVIALISIYITLAIYFNNRYWFGTTINGVDATGKDVAAIEQELTAGINGYKLELNLRDSQQEVIKGTEIGLSLIFDGSLEKELTAQNSLFWITSLFKKTDITVETMVDFEKEKFKLTLNNLSCLNPQNVKKPKNAYISKYKPGIGYKVIKEVEGNQLNRRRMGKIIKEAVINMKDSVSLEENNSYNKPKIRVKNKQLVSRVKNLNKYVNTTIQYKFGEKTENLNGSIIKDWLSVNQQNEVILDEGKANEYVESLANKYNTAFQPKNLKTTYGTTITVPSGDYGWWIDEEGELKQLLSELSSGQEITREPIYRQRANSYQENDYGNTYVEINLTAQRLFFYKEGRLLVDTEFVSGNLSKGYDTPTGAYGITYTERNATLVGDDYRTPVSYWMPFNGGVGMHDATWRKKFGGSYYKYNGSHGCINLPFQKAKQIFENINSGDPVLVYELPGTENGKVLVQDSAANIT